MRKRTFLPLSVLALGAIWNLHAADSKPATFKLKGDNVSLKLEIQSAIDRGADSLAKNQNAAGWWSRSDTPAISAMVLTSLQGDPSGRAAREHADQLKRGYQFILSNVKPDGGIYLTNYPNYNTAVSVMALLAARNPGYDPVIRKARSYLIGLQGDFGEKGKLDDPFDGGVGYGSHGPHSDMSNTLLALEAVYRSKHLVEDKSLTGAKDLNWDAVLHFIQNCQNLPEYNKQPWATGDAKDKGGFIYSPTESKVPEVKLPDGKVALRSYGSISYAGMLSYVYADLKPTDARVKAVREWLGANYTLDENPGMGQQGRFYYYHTMAKALTAANMDALVLSDGSTVDWRKQLAERLLGQQSADGSWANENNRWMEKDTSLVTAYALIALEMIHRGL